MKLTLTEKYIPNKVKDLVGENETTDSTGRNVFAILNKDLTQQTTGVPDIMVASVSFLHKADATSCAKASTNLNAVWRSRTFYPSNAGHTSLLLCEITELNDAVVKEQSVFLNTRKRKHQYQRYLEEETSKPPRLFPMPVIT
ncbi:hypothetical protein PR048_018818 [Dryococelus australis]|uniref:Uncharacterized protein n=1 Tax=Dryococelus australis TaxID=614101 RepID=A0ABQ9H227_9NEOP|nr:hypothetical protein PR048_018818 [Dryococelus australis]